MTGLIEQVILRCIWLPLQLEGTCCKNVVVEAYEGELEKSNQMKIMTLQQRHRPNHVDRPCVLCQPIEVDALSDP